MSEVSSGGIEATEREPSFDDLLTADDSPASDPQTDPEHDAAAAEQPTGNDADARQTARETEDERSPFIPRQRFDEVNTKLKEAKTWRDQYAWAEGLQPEAVQTMREWFGKAAADPRAFALNLLDELSQHPDHAASVRSELAKRLGTRSAKDAEADSAEGLQPDIEILDAEGKAIGRTYSDKALGKFAEQIRQQTLADVETRYADKFTSLETIQKREAETQAEASAQQFATSFIQELSQLPQFADHKSAIAQYIQSHPPKGDSPEAVAANAFRAYYAVVGPKLGSGAQTQEAVMADLQRKARANTGINPGAASSASPKAPSDFFDPSIEW